MVLLEVARRNAIDQTLNNRNEDGKKYLEMALDFLRLLWLFWSVIADHCSAKRTVLPLFNTAKSFSTVHERTNSFKYTCTHIYIQFQSFFARVTMRSAITEIVLLAHTTHYLLGARSFHVHTINAASFQMEKFV